MNEEVELIPMEDGKFYMRLEDVNKSIEVATFELQQENQSLKQQCEIVEKRLCDEYQDMLEKRNKLFVENCKLKDRVEKAIEYIEELYDNTDDITCYDIDRSTRDELLLILKFDERKADELIAKADALLKGDK